jgi:CRISPR-associated protein Cas6
VLRLPRERVEDALALEGCELDLAGNPLKVGPGKVRPLQKATTLHSRHAHFADVEDEGLFIEVAAKALKQQGIGFKKILCGKPHVIADGEQQIATRSLMVADLSLEDSVRLQQLGLGDHHLLGCGLFIPHKPV